MKKGDPDKPATVHMTSETHGRHQRPSLIEFLTGGDLRHHVAPKSASEQLIQQKGMVLPKNALLKASCGLVAESSSSASYGSTPPNQNLASASDSHEPNINDTSTPFNAPTGLNMPLRNSWPCAFLSEALL